MRDLNVELFLWGKKISTKLVFSGEEDVPLTVAQQQAYDSFIQNPDRFSAGSLHELKAYIHSNEQEILAYTSYPAIPRDVFMLLNVEAICFYENGAVAVFCDTYWDSHGLAILYRDYNFEVMPPERIWFYT